MKQVVIENPVINSPFEEPSRHFRFTDEGITNEIVDGRRRSSYFVPIPPSKKRKGATQLSFNEWTNDRVQENELINEIRHRVSAWRKLKYPGITRTTAALLEHWTRPDRDRRLFFCQIEALETVIYITEAIKQSNDAWLENRLRQENDKYNPLLYRLAFKMATGSGKTVVMSGLIAWHVLNKLANPQDARFSDSFLIITPGITIKDRLRVLLPNDPDNYYRKWDIAPPDLMPELDKAKIIITNFHAFKPRETLNAGSLTKKVLTQGGTSPFTETPDQMVRRVCRELGNKKNIVVINDEAHHCYRHKPDGNGEKLTGDDRQEAAKREEEARVWISGLEAVKSKLGIRAVYDLSATPFFLRGSGYSEGTLFPWVVSDFSLIDAIESGIVKVPRVPVADDSMAGEQPTYRELWLHIRDSLPKKGRGTEKITGQPQLPTELEGALKSLYGNYKKQYALWEKADHTGDHRLTPPVFIVVCNNTNVSKLVYDYIAGWEKTLANGVTVLVPGELDLFSNVEDDRWAGKPNTILIDSSQLESGEGMTTEFKKMAAKEIQEFKDEYIARFPGRNAEDLTDEDLLREVMNTVGKPGKLGENIKCVVSVSMLTEGWDANTVTHILGIRAFGTQLLCEQVVGRALRRMSYALNDNGMFDPEYAEVYGVPFSFIPTSGTNMTITPGPAPTRVRALPGRAGAEITFPRVTGYRYDLADNELVATFTNDSKMILSTEELPTWTENAPIIGEKTVDTLDELKQRRVQEVAFLLAKLVLERYFRADDKDTTSWAVGSTTNADVKAWLFPQVLRISKAWLDECVICKDNMFPQILLLKKQAEQAASKIYLSLASSESSRKTLMPMLRPYDTIGSTRYVDFDTVRPVYPTDPDKCHVTYVVADTNSWEQKLAQALEEMDEVVAYVKNYQLGFNIPYTIEGEQRNYVPDYIIRYNDGKDDLLNLIVEVTGERKKDKEAKVATARNLWIPAINNHGGFGRWAFIELGDPWDAKHTIRAVSQGNTKAGS